MSLDDRLDSWKAISSYLKRDVTTVQRWEKREGMPVHRHVHDKQGSVYAYRSELDQWMRSRSPASTTEVVDSAIVVPRAPRRLSLVAALAVVVLLIGAAVMWWPISRPNRTGTNPLDHAEFQMVTDFEGTEQAAAVSRDGRLVAFTSDRDGPMDVWVTQLGTGQFHNLTRGRVQQLVNPAVRTLAFSPDGAFVTFWARGVEGATTDDIGIWAIPTLGGQPTPYLEGVAEFDWSPGATQLIFHTPGPGDPMFLGGTQRDRDQKIFEAVAGLHAHFPTWAPAGDWIYFVQGTVPDGMDVWRIKPDGQAAERITNHNHPILLNDRTVLYLAGVGDGSGPRLHTIDVDERVPHILGTSLDRFTSLAVSGDRQRIVATRANPKATLWRLPISQAPAAPTAMKAVSLPTGRVFAPRLGPGYLLYASQKGNGDAIWKLTDGGATELWSAPDARIFGGPEISSDGLRLAFSVERAAKTFLYTMNSDGTNLQLVSDSLQLRGSPAWAPDGRSIASGAGLHSTPQLFRISFDAPPMSFSTGFAIDPVWSPDGEFVVYTAADVGTEFPVKAVTANGQPRPAPALTLTRGARRLRFFQRRRALIMMRGDIRHKDLWLVDLDTGHERQLTQLPPDFNIRDFDVSPDGTEILVERVQDHADVVLIDLAKK